MSQSSPDATRGVILGLTGSLGSGKSFAASCFESAGAVVICADTLAREAVAKGSPLLAQIQEEFGAEMVLESGELDRVRLASVVFADPSRRKNLEEIVHPHVRAQELLLINAHRSHPLIVVDVPLLFETGFESHCDNTLVITIDEETRLERLLTHRKMSGEEVKKRLAHQMPQAEKVRRASFVVDNSQDKNHTIGQLNRVLNALFPGALPPPLREIPFIAP